MSEKQTVGRISFSPYKTEKLKPFVKNLVSLEFCAIRDSKGIALDLAKAADEISRLRRELFNAQHEISRLQGEVERYKKLYSDECRISHALSIKLDQHNIKYDKA